MQGDSVAARDVPSEAKLQAERDAYYDSLPDEWFLHTFVNVFPDDTTGRDFMLMVAASGANVGAIIRVSRMLEPWRKRNYEPEPIDRARPEHVQWPEHVAWARDVLGQRSPEALVYELALRRMLGMPVAAQP